MTDKKPIPKAQVRKTPHGWQVYAAGPKGHIAQGQPHKDLGAAKRDAKKFEELLPEVDVDPRMAIAAKRRAMELAKRKAIAARLAQSRQGKETQAAAVAGRQGVRKQQATKFSQKRWKEEAENIVDTVAAHLTSDFDPRTHKVPRPAGMSKKQFDYKYKPTKVRKPKKDTGMKTPETQAALKYLQGKGPSPYGPGGKYEPKKEDVEMEDADIHRTSSRTRRLRGFRGPRGTGDPTHQTGTLKRLRKNPKSGKEWYVKKEEVEEAADTWHPDPEKDKQSTSYKHHVKTLDRPKVPKKVPKKDPVFKRIGKVQKVGGKWTTIPEEHDCKLSHPGMTHTEWKEDQKIEAQYAEDTTKVKAKRSSRKFRQVTPGQVRDYEKLSAARMFQAYEQKTDEEMPATNTSGVANWDPLLGGKKTTVYTRKRRRIDGRTKDYKETVQRVQARRDALAARELEQKLNMFGVQSNPFKEETEMENNKKYLKTKEGSIEEAVMKSLMTETPVNPNDARPTLHLPEKKYLLIKEGSIEEAVANVMTMTDDHVPGHPAKPYKLPRQLKDPKKEKMVGTKTGTKVVDKSDPRYRGAPEHESVELEDYSLAPKGKGSKAAKLLYGKRTGKNRVQPESAAGRGERDVGSQEYTDYVKNLTPGEGDSAVVDRDAQKAAKASQEANKEKKLRSTRIDDEYVVEKEVKVKDTRRTVDAIRAYYRSKDASRDATSDTDRGEKEKGDIEKKYAKKERGEIKQDDPNWKSRKYHTGMHGEETGAEAGHATALYKDQWKDRKRADWDKEHGREKMAKQDRADAEVDRKRMWGLTGDKWKHAKYASGEEEGKRTIDGNTPSPTDAYKKEESEMKEGEWADTKAQEKKDSDRLTAIHNEREKRYQAQQAKKKQASENTELDEKDWIKGAIKKPGALRRQLDVPAGKNIPAAKLKDAAKAGGKLGQRARLAITLKKMHDEYEAEADDGLMEHDHHELGFDTRADMIGWAAEVLEINEIGDAELPLVDAVLKDLLAEIHTAKDTSHLDKAIADFKKKGGKVTQVKSKGIPKWAQAAHQRSGPPSAHRQYKPGSGKSEEVEIDEFYGDEKGGDARLHVPRLKNKPARERKDALKQRLKKIGMKHAEEVEIDEVGDTRAGRQALKGYIQKGVGDIRHAKTDKKAKQREKGIQQAAARIGYWKP